MSFSYPWFRPFNRWPLAVHASLAGALLLAVWGVGYRMVQNAQRQQVQANESLVALKAQAKLHSAAAKSTPLEAAPNFTQSLPVRETIDDVVRDMGRHAQTLNLALGTLSVVHQTATLRELGKVQLTLTAYGEYGKAKAWLSELLARYPSLAVQTLSVRAAADPTRQEWQLVLALYVKD